MSRLFQQLVGFEYYVRDLDRIGRFYQQRLGFSRSGRSSPALEQRSRERSYAFQVGNIGLVCSAPLGDDSRAARYLARHPEGIGSLVFEVADIRQTFARLEHNGATPIS